MNKLELAKEKLIIDLLTNTLKTAVEFFGEGLEELTEYRDEKPHPLPAQSNLDNSFCQLRYEMNKCCELMREFFSIKSKLCNTIDISKMNKFGKFVSQISGIDA